MPPGRATHREQAIAAQRRHQVADRQPLDRNFAVCGQDTGASAEAGDIERAAGVDENAGQKATEVRIAARKLRRVAFQHCRRVWAGERKAAEVPPDCKNEDGEPATNWIDEPLPRHFKRDRPAARRAFGGRRVRQEVLAGQQASQKLPIAVGRVRYS